MGPNKYPGSGHMGPSEGIFILRSGGRGPLGTQTTNLISSTLQISSGRWRAVSRGHHSAELNTSQITEEHERGATSGNRNEKRKSASGNGVFFKPTTLYTIFPPEPGQGRGRLKVGA